MEDGKGKQWSSGSFVRLGLLSFFALLISSWKDVDMR